VTDRLLCIGGSKDGQTIPYDGRVTQVARPLPISWRSVSAIPEMTKVEVEYYVEEVLTVVDKDGGGPCRFPFYLLQGMAYSDAMAALFKRYAEGGLIGRP